MIGIRINNEQADALHDTLNEAFINIMAQRPTEPDTIRCKELAINNIMAARRTLDRMGIHHSRALRQLNAG
ncbi:MAG: hypothetical protein ABIL58_20095 [Pseudomonadota bacterium]